MSLDILYFAWVRGRVGVGSETVDPPAEVTTLTALLDWLATRSPGHAAALADRAALRFAIDQDFVPEQSPLPARAEIAIFPPVTGG